jgi:pyridoxal 5'-phosphate synthase pdxT subunit
MEQVQGPCEQRKRCCTGDTGRPLTVRQRNVIACAFHPELTGDLRVHRMLLDG